jgi:DNA-binding MarR family transcriptional regulator
MVAAGDAAVARSDQDPSQVDPEVVRQTLQASRAMLGIIARSVGTALEDVSLPQLRALVLLDQLGPTRSGALAEQLGVHPSTFSRNADRLVAGGWVRRVEDVSSRQAVQIELTEAGRHVVEQVTQQRRSGLAEVLARLDVDQQRALHDAFTAFARAAGEPDPKDLQTLAI